MVKNKKRAKLIQWSEVFDTRLYPLKALEQAIKDYGGFGKFTTQQMGQKVKVKAAIPAESDFHFKEEFSNYVLGMVIKCR